MEIDRILYPIHSLGPGNRLVIWTVGCSKHCRNCSNEELWARDDSRDIPPNELSELIIRSLGGEKIDGITFTGGDPLEQADDLLIVAEKLHTLCSDILVYTGYTIEELEALFPLEKLSRLKELVSVLIEGRYIDELNDSKVPLRGSVNQRILFFDQSLEAKYRAYMSEGRKIQNVYKGEKIISVGIHNKDLGKHAETEKAK